MARTRTLLQLREDVRWQSDKEGFTSRHTDARVTRALNQSIQEFREHISEAGDPYYLTNGTGTMTVGALFGLPFGAITMATNLGRIYGVDIVTNNRWTPLRAASFEERTDYQGASGIQVGTPEKFFLYGELVIALLPASATALTHAIWYLPPLTDLSADGDTFDGQYGWEEYVVLNACAKLHMRDDEPERLAAVISERDRLLTDIKARASNRQRQGVQKRQDVRFRHFRPRDWLTRWR